MAKYQREATQYPGVFWLTIQGIETLYIRYKRPGTAKAVEEKLGSKAQGWTAPRGNAERAKRINGQAKSNAEQREFRITEKLVEESWSQIRTAMNYISKIHLVRKLQMN